MTNLELKVGERYGIAEFVELAGEYKFLNYVDFEIEGLINKFGEGGALIEIGEDRYVVAPDERGGFVVLAHYNPKSGEGAEIFTGVNQ